jgi:Tfp pilus assembly pilus retraction ATPase PilT
LQLGLARRDGQAQEPTTEFAASAHGSAGIQEAEVAASAELRATLDKAIALARERHASAIVLATGELPCFVQHRNRVPVSKNRLDEVQVNRLFETVLSPTLQARLAATGQALDNLRWGPLGRVRILARRWAGGASLHIEPLPMALPSFADLQLPPEACARAASVPRGLVLVASASAASRAAVLSAFARHRASLPNSRLILDQAQPAYSYEDICAAEAASASPGPLDEGDSEAPDQAGAAVLVEDLDSIAAVKRALQWAEHALCLAAAPRDSLHTLFEWIDDDSASDGLLMATADRLVMAIGVLELDARGASALRVSEVLPFDDAVRLALRDGRLGELFDFMSRQPSPGTRTRDQHLLQLLAERRISHDEALKHAQRPDSLRWALQAMQPPPLPQDWSPFGELLGGSPAGSAASVDPFAGFGIYPPAPVSPRPASRPEDLDPFLVDLAPERPGTMPPAVARRDSVQFRVYTPSQVAPGDLALVDLWACLPAQADEVAALAASTSQSRQAGLRAGVPLQRDVLLTLRLESASFVVRSSPQTMSWTGEPCNVSFEIAVPLSQAPGLVPARVHLAAEGVPLGCVHFMLAVQQRSSAESFMNPSARTQLFRSAFASYATPDRAEMLARIQGMKKIAPDLDVFVDALSLRSGERWQQRIEQEVRQRERLFLFWSRHARNSEWVEFEWRLAQRTKGLTAIDPVPLEEPIAAPPPEELSALHFGDAYLAHIHQARPHLSR